MYQQRVIYQDRVKGRQFVNSELYDNFMLGDLVKGIHRKIIKHLTFDNVFDPTIALSAKELAELIGCTTTHITENIKLLTEMQILLMVKDEENPRLNRYYLNSQHKSTISRTAVAESVERKFKKVNK